jgi:hypothetical protein
MLRPWPAKTSGASTDGDALFGNVEAVAGEDQRRVDRRRRIDRHPEIRVVAERQRQRPAVAHERKARMRFVDPPRPEHHRLDVAACSSGLQRGLLELRRDVLGGPFVFRAAGVAPAHRVVGEELDVLPPRVAVGVQIVRAFRPARQQGDRDGEAPDAALHSWTT